MTNAIGIVANKFCTECRK